jgi:hypothetical protein
MSNNHYFVACPSQVLTLQLVRLSMPDPYIGLWTTLKQAIPLSDMHHFRRKRVILRRKFVILVVE